MRLEVEDYKGFLTTFLSVEMYDELSQSAWIEQVKEGEEFIQAGSYLKKGAIILTGSVQVEKVDDGGKKLYLYTLQGGDACAATFLAEPGVQVSEITMKSITDSVILFFPLELMVEWMHKFPKWNSYILKTYSNRFYDLLSTVEGIAFKKLDERLLKFLREKAKLNKYNMVEMTHSEIAANLGTSREVISRLLKQLEKESELELGRNKIFLK